MAPVPGVAAPADPTAAAVSARRLLARLRDVMAGGGTPQYRLDKIVRVIAPEMMAEVCSCYVMRPGDVLELFSTVGLKADAVHLTRLRVGEGLVGTIAANARPLAFEDAPAHPNFAYRPETGEEAFRSLMGVPILRGGKVRGVLAIQNRQRRRYAEDEVEILETVAMLLAELIANSIAGEFEQVTGPGAPGMLPTRIEGISLNGGLAEGLAVLHRPQPTIRELVADDPDWERHRFDHAVAVMHSSLDALIARTAGTGITESHEILSTYRMIAEDRGWLGRIHEAINAGLTAEAAVQRVQNDMNARFAHVTDPYLRGRLLDFDDLANRALLHLSGRSSLAATATLPDRMVLVARALGPAELLEYDRNKLVAVVLEDGTATSHVAIIAKALGLPIVGRCADAMTLIEPLDPLIIDADNGNVFVRPAEDVQDAFRESQAVRAERRRTYAELAPLPGATLDGVTVSLNLNAGLLADVPHLVDTGADGIGLYRTEIPFMVRPAYPEVEEQTELYARVLDQAGGRPVVFRTLDVGGDKVLPYFEAFQQDNPALGWRGIRIGLDRPAMLRKQLRAFLRAARGRPLGIMFPMIAEVAEFDAARTLLALECERLERDGLPLPPLRIGAMVEVPAMLWQLPAILARADFLAVGSNDLLQYLFAVDRGNPKVAARYDALSPPVFNLFADLLEHARSAGVPVSLCGEIAGRPLEAMAMVGLGFRNLSMAPGGFGPVKAMIRSLTLAPLAEYLTDLRRSPAHSLRDHLRAFAADHNVQI